MKKVCGILWQQPMQKNESSKWGAINVLVFLLFALRSECGAQGIFRHPLSCLGAWRNDIIVHCCILLIVLAAR